jgi:DNA-binding LacI/PurR family transcriptional regulator
MGSSSNHLKRPTIHDVARAAGVSKSTVSRVLNDRGYASSETIARVERAVAELNYIPQASARGLVSQQTNTVGFAVNDLSTLFIPPLLSSIESTIRTAGYKLLIATVGHQAESASGLPLGPHNTDGLVAFADAYSDRQIVQFCEQGYPVVLLHRSPPAGVECPCVNIENTSSTRALINHLIRVHHTRRIVFLRGPKDQQDSLEREEGYRQALAENDLAVDPALIAVGGFNADIAEQVTHELLDASVPFDAVFAGDDEAAVGVIRALKDRSLSVPEDVAVVGFDDDYRAADIDPALTTVSVPFNEIGEEAAQALISYIEHGHITSNVVSTEVVIRRSCGCQAKK